MGRPTQFADLITADCNIIADSHVDNLSRDGHRTAYVMQDWFTRTLAAYPSKTRTTEEVKMHNMLFLGPRTTPKAYFSDNAAEIKSAVVALGCPPASCTPHVPQTSGIAENCVRKVSEGTACLLLQPGFSAHWWSDAMQCFCFSRNTIWWSELKVIWKN